MAKKKKREVFEDGPAVYSCLNCRKIVRHEDLLNMNVGAFFVWCVHQRCYECQEVE